MTRLKETARCAAFCIAAGIAFAALSLMAVSAVFGIDAVALVRGANNG